MSTIIFIAWEIARIALAVLPCHHCKSRNRRATFGGRRMLLSTFIYECLLPSSPREVLRYHTFCADTHACRHYGSRSHSLLCRQ